MVAIHRYYRLTKTHLIASDECWRGKEHDTKAAAIRLLHHLLQFTAHAVAPAVCPVSALASSLRNIDCRESPSFNNNCQCGPESRSLTPQVTALFCLAAAAPPTPYHPLRPTQQPRRAMVFRKGSKRNIATNASVKFCRCNSCIRATKLTKFPDDDRRTTAAHDELNDVANSKGGFRASRLLASLMGAQRSGPHNSAALEQRGKTAARAALRKAAEFDLAEEIAAPGGAALLPTNPRLPLTLSASSESSWSDDDDCGSDDGIIEFELATGLDDDECWLSEEGDDMAYESLVPLQGFADEDHWPKLRKQHDDGSIGQSGPASISPISQFYPSGAAAARMGGRAPLSVVVEEAESEGAWNGDDESWVVLSSREAMHPYDDGAPSSVPYAEVVRGSNWQVLRCFDEDAPPMSTTAAADPAASY